MKAEQTEEQNWLITTCLLVLATVAGAAALIYTRGVLIPFVLAIFIATIVAPVVDVLMVRLRFPRPLAVIAAILVVLAVLSLVLLLMIIAGQTVADTSGDYAEKFRLLAQNGLGKVNGWIHDLNENAPKIETADILSKVTEVSGTVATEGVSVVRKLVTQATLTLIFVAFILAGRNPQVVRKGIYAEIDSKVRRYIVTKVLISSVTGILVYVLLRLMGLPMASLFGILAFLLNFIPSVGSIVATLLPLPIAVAHYDSMAMIVLAIALPGALQITIGNVIEPKLMGEGLELHPVTILLALAFWGLLWGIVGMVLAVPMTATVRIVLMRFETTRPVGQLLAGRLPEDISAA